MPVDFGSQDLETELASAGVQRSRATFFAWLGVTQYISEEATYRTLSLVASHAPGSEVVFDVIRPFEGLAPDEEPVSVALASKAAREGRVRAELLVGLGLRELSVASRTQFARSTSRAPRLWLPKRSKPDRSPRWRRFSLAAARPRGIEAHPRADLGGAHRLFTPRRAAEAQPSIVGTSSENVG